MNMNRRTQHRLALKGAWFLTLLSTLVACGGFVDVDAPTWAREIGAGGGVVVSGAASLSVPGGALEGAERIEILPVEQVVSGSVGHGWDLRPTELRFELPATLRLCVDPDQLLGETRIEDLRLARLDPSGQHFETIASSSAVHVEGTVGGTILSLGVFFLVCDDGDPCTDDRYDETLGCLFEATACGPVDDRDGDGDPDESDCAPDDRAIFHGAEERCNALDDDCDGETDEEGEAALVTPLCEAERSCQHGLCTPVDCVGALGFADAGLEAAVREALGALKGEIWWDDLRGVVSLDASARAVSSLQGVACLRGLETLDLSGNDIEMIDELSSLSELWSLDLSDNRIVDLGALSALPELALLELAENQITSVGALVDNEGIGDGDDVDLVANPIDCEAEADNLSELLGRGVTLSTDCSE
jgi:hypothetical protein